MERAGGPQSESEAAPSLAAPRAPARHKRAVIVALVGVWVLVGVGIGAILVASDLPEPLRDAQAAVVQAWGEPGEPNPLQRAVDAVTAARSNAGPANAWLQARGVEQAALPAAARAYRQQFGHSMDEDLQNYGPDVEAWLVSWQAAYRRGEPWARGMVTQPDSAGGR
jgi:hypothetical protein